MVILAWALFALAQAAPSAPSASPARSPAAMQPEADEAQFAAARALVDVVLPPDSREARFGAAIGAMMANMTSGIVKAQGLEAEFQKEPRLRPIFAAFVERQRKLAMDDLRNSMPELVLAYTRAYARLFTRDELVALRAFFSTPLGQKYLSVSPKVLADPDVAAWQRGVAERGQKRMPEEVDKLLEDIAPILKQDAAQTQRS